MEHDRCQDVFRAITPGYEFREDGDSGPTLSGHFAVFNEWTEINSLWEGHFMERIAPGAFKKTFSENLDRMRVLFQHGQDPQIGDKPLGPISDLREDETGAFYSVPLLRDESGAVVDYIRGLIPGLREKLYGASFRFKVMKEEFEEEPGVSESNPNGLAERTVTEARVMEFGPVTFPAYASATAGLRSVTDEFRFPREVLELIGDRAAALRREEPEPEVVATPEPVASRSTQVRHDYLSEKEEQPKWQL